MNNNATSTIKYNSLDLQKSYELQLDMGNLSALDKDIELQIHYEMILDRKYDIVNQHIENVLSTASNQLAFSAILVTFLGFALIWLQYRIQQSRESLKNEIKQDVKIEIDKINDSIAIGLLPEGEVKTKIIQAIIDSHQFNEAVKILIDSKTNEENKKKTIEYSEQTCIYESSLGD